MKHTNGNNGSNPDRTQEASPKPSSGSTGEITFYLVRHGETDFNRTGRLQGHTDTELNETGKKQALRVADKAKNFNLNGIVASDLKRAHQTASIISNALSVPVIQTTTALREASFGILDGMTYEEIARMHNQSVEKLMEAGLDRLPGVESRESLSRRALDFLAKVAEETSDRRLLVVTHGGIMRSVAGKILGVELTYLSLLNGDIMTLKLSGGEWSLQLPEHEH